MTSGYSNEQHDEANWHDDTTQDKLHKCQHSFCMPFSERVKIYEAWQNKSDSCRTRCTYDAEDFPKIVEGNGDSQRKRRIKSCNNPITSILDGLLIIIPLGDISRRSRWLG